MAIKKFRTGVLAGCGLAAAVVTAQSANAATVYNTFFETSDGFTPGNIVGQGSKYPFAANPSNSTSMSGAIATSAAGFSGQVAQITATNAAAGAFGGYYPTIPVGTVNTAATPYVSYSFTLSATNTGTGTAGFGTSIFNAVTPTSSQIFDLYVLPSTGDVLVDGGTGGTASVADLTSSTPGVSTSGVNTFSVTFNYTGATGIYTVSENGTQIDTGTFVDTNGFGRADLAAAGFDSNPSSGVGTFDNYSVSAVPEPTTASLVVGGLAAAGLRRRRRAAAR